MGYDERVAERVRNVLAGQRHVVEKRMVGGLSFMVNGSMCCGVTGTALMVRVGPEGLAGALARPHVRRMVFAGRPLTGFVCVDPAGYGTNAALAAWVQWGIDFVSTLPAKKPAARRPPSSSAQREGKLIARPGRPGRVRAPRAKPR
jgi:hypothetical protein